MAKRSIIHMLNPMAQNSPFDINMAMDAGYDVIIPYNNVTLEQVTGLTQDAIFSRGPKGVKKTGLFIGGRDISLAMDMLNVARQAMVPPFAISIMADPSGAFTTAAALVACIEHELDKHFRLALKELHAVVFGGTGSVGLATAVIAAGQGVNTTIVDHFSLDNALVCAADAKQRYDVTLRATAAISDADKAHLIAHADIIFCAAKAGVEVLNTDTLKSAKALKVIGDVNAVPPLGVAGIDVMDMGKPLADAMSPHSPVGIGALAVGNIKYQLQQTLLKTMLQSEKPVYLDFCHAFDGARKLLD